MAPPTQMPAACGAPSLPLGGSWFVGNSAPGGPPADRQRGRVIRLFDHSLLVKRDLLRPRGRSEKRALMYRWKSQQGAPCVRNIRIGAETMKGRLSALRRLHACGGAGPRALGHFFGRESQSHDQLVRSQPRSVRSYAAALSAETGQTLPATSDEAARNLHMPKPAAHRVKNE